MGEDHMKTILGATFVSMLMLAPALAGEMQGKVKEVDAKKHMITLEDGMSVMTTDKVKLDNVMAGDTVKIMTGDDKMATSVEKMK
jgi:ribosomal protein L24